MIKSLIKFVEDPEFNLAKLFHPSFSLPLISISSNGFRAVKEHGYCRGTELVIDGGKLYALSDSIECIQYSRYLSGSWYDARDYLEEVHEDFKDLVSEMIPLYTDVSIATSPLDDLELFTSIILSRNTDYHRNTVRWVKKILESFPSIESLINAEPLSLATEISGSYQVLELPKTLRCYLRIRNSLSRSPESSRALLTCPGVGPKTLYAYMLFVKLNPSYAPIDTNMLKFLNRLKGLREVAKKLTPPAKNYCLRYVCDECPVRKTCVEAFLRSRLGRLSGWFQTVVFLHSKTFCLSRGCGKCPLSRECLIGMRA
jgi:endonuclease III